ncbi:MAG: glycosyltransferase family 2 protein [Salinibacterium sp.]|nr:glycosyltransferase family 2 protein [Salinibacterium sp.]
MTTTISVALCTHNGAKYIEAQLRSILAQSVLPIQIVVSDDASQDGTLSVVHGVLGTAQAEAVGITVTVLNHVKNVGVTSNFERALLACTGDLVALCDQDDIWHLDRLESARRRFEDSPELLLLHSDARLVDRDGEALGYSLFDALDLTDEERAAITGGRGFEALLKRNLITGATTMIRRTLVDRATPFPKPWVHDEWLGIVAAATGRIDLLPEQLIDYRQHGTNQIGVRRLGIRGKIGRIFEPRGGRNLYLASRAAVMASRLALLGDLVPERITELADGKLRHLKVRAELPDGRLGRLAPVLREIRTGRYSRFSRGRGDILRDLLQPAGSTR